MLPVLKRTGAFGAAKRLMDAHFRLALLPFGRDRRRGVPREVPDLVARTDDLNRAADRYFSATGSPEFLLRKPFSDETGFGRHLFSLGVLITALRLTRADVVAEFGAGSCWVSHMLNRFGCKTFAIDVSPAALALGKELFRRDPATNWDLAPEFVAYDGHRLPLRDGCCTRVVIFDAFHHVPNQREILSELHRILTPDGMVAMSEPGTGHADTEASRREVAAHGVLENELVVEDVAALAMECGFAAARLVVASPDALWEIPAADLGAFIRGKGFTRFWNHLSGTLVSSHFLLLYKGDPEPTTRQPKSLGALISVRGRSAPVRARAGRPTPVSLRIVNTGETRWLAAPADGVGWTRLGAHLYHAVDGGLVDFDWFRVELPKDIGRQDRLDIVVNLPPISEPGTYRVDFDLVIEGVTWFANRGSRPASVLVRVE